EGGVEIEEVAARNPDAIKRTAVDPTVGFQPYQGRELALAIGLTGDLMRPATAVFAGLYKLFEENDCSLAEINPLVVTKDGRLLAADAKLNIGCVVNGAGLAMATMDAITLAGGEPANFLDIGTVNDPERVIASFRIIMDDPDVKAMLINIFGGMARVDIIAQGIISAYKEIDIKVPVVARLVGTNVEEG